MWTELLEDIQLELGLLHKLLDETAALRESIAAGAGGGTEKLAAASLLQSFYNGVENVFDTLAERMDGHRPAGAGRHEPLLRQMAEPRGDRPAVLSQDLHAALKQYLEFRNSYRYSHYFRLNWPLMAALAAQLAPTLERLEAELDQFLRGHAQRRLIGRAEATALPPYWFAPPPEAQTGRWRGLGGPCALAALIGLALGAGLAAAVRGIQASRARHDLPAADVRKLADALAARTRPWQAEPAVRHAAGVLEFFRRDDWKLTFAGDRWDLSGDATGASPSLSATARLSLAQGELRRIEIVTSFDRYVFTAEGGALRRATHAAVATGAPRTILDFARDGSPSYLAEWAEQQGRTTRRDRHFRDGRCVLEVAVLADGTVGKVLVRTGDRPQDATVFVPADGGVLAPDPAARDALRDLPAPTATQPAAP